MNASRREQIEDENKHFLGLKLKHNWTIIITIIIVFINCRGHRSVKHNILL